MATKVKKAKGSKKNPFEFWGLLSGGEKAIVCIPIIALVAVIIGGWFYLSNHKPISVQDAHVALASHMTTNGEWSTFGTYGIDVWMPKDIAAEVIEGDAANYTKLCVTRDKGGFPEIAIGSFVIPGTYSSELNMETDTSIVLEMIRPYIYDSFATMFNGVDPALNGDINVTTINEEKVLEFDGTAELTVVYQDPTGKTNEGEPYSETTPTMLYYMAKMYNGRVVCVWGTWDYSTYQGEEKVKAAVLDGIYSVTRSENAPDKVTENFEIPFESDDGLSDADKSSGLVAVPYEGASGTQYETPVDSEGNPINPEGWVNFEDPNAENSGDSGSASAPELDEFGNPVGTTYDEQGNVVSYPEN